MNFTLRKIWFTQTNFMNNFDLRIILMIINWERKTKYQQTIISETQFSETSYFATPDCYKVSESIEIEEFRIFSNRIKTFQIDRNRKKIFESI